MLRPFLNVGLTGDGVLSRRGFVKALGLGAAGVATLGWRDMLLAQSNELRRRGKSMILLWMDGGPSQFETFNPKPGSANQGPAKAIDTAVSGIQFADFWPKTAQVADKMAIIRSMSTRVAEHDRAINLMRTGYPFQPAIRYPTFGSVVSLERQNPDFELPPFVRIGKPRIATRDVDHGVLGVRHSYFHVEKPGSPPPNTTLPVGDERLKRRLALAGQFDAEFAARGGQEATADRKEVYDRTSKFLLSPRMNVFDLSSEPTKLRDEYGRTTFGQGCLLARRLVEQGVSFVEVISTGEKNDAGWDTHGAGFRDTPNLCNEVDPAYSTLLRDLDTRGLLKDTLVVWMGEFGRTPKLKTDGGRDHYAEGWITCLSGGGVKMGQVIGATDADGVKVTQRPIDVPDLFTTFCHVLGIDPRREYHTPDERPVKIVEGGQLIRELF